MPDSLLERAVRMMGERKAAATGLDADETERLDIRDVEATLRLVASTWNVDAEEVVGLAGLMSATFLRAGILIGMAPVLVLRSAWLDGFMVGLAHAHLAQREGES